MRMIFIADKETVISLFHVERILVVMG